MPFKLVYLSQQDPQWKNDLLGFGDPGDTIKTVMMNGMFSIILAWAGSAEVGVIFWEMNWVIPIRMGVT